jgi:hypothetical protein
MVDAVDVVQIARYCHRKMLLSLLSYVALHYRMHDQPPFTALSTPSNDLREIISDLVGGREHLFFWHDMASTTWNPWGVQPNVGINVGL